MTGKEPHREIKILFSPDKDDNQYLSNMISILGSIENISLEFSKKFEPVNLFKKLKYYDFAIINWFENSLIDKNKKVTVITLLKTLLKFLYLNVVSKKVIYVRHNMYPHSTSGYTAVILKRITDFLARLSYKTVVHSGHFGSQYDYVPHPLYRFESKIENPIREDRFVVFGRIVTYKAIDKLLNVWGQSKLLIAGSVGSSEYLYKLKTIKEKRSLDSVNFDARFISNEESQQLVSKARGLILTHSDDDMIVSGSFFFAASLGTPVLAIKSPFLCWLKESFAYPGLYLYENLELMVRDIETNNLAQPNQAELIQISEQLFGDKIVQTAWKRILNI